MPPKEGLQLISPEQSKSEKETCRPILAAFWVRRAVRAPHRAAAAAASVPACPPPTTITSYSGRTRPLSCRHRILLGRASKATKEEKNNLRRLPTRRRSFCVLRVAFLHIVPIFSRDARQSRNMPEIIGSPHRVTILFKSESEDPQTEPHEAGRWTKSTPSFSKTCV